MSLHRNGGKTVTKTEVGYCCGMLDHVLRTWVREAMKCFKDCSIGHSTRIIEDSSAEGDQNRLGLPQVVSEEGNFNTLLRDHSCDILERSVTTLV